MKSKAEFDIAKHLEEFARISKKSKEFQGHGWGISYLKNEGWQHYRNILPVWEDSLEKFGKTTLLLAHARSAFKDKDIVVENNMPFHDDKYVFTFNGELRGVRIDEKGRIGAEKIFNFIKRFDNGNMQDALFKAVGLIKKRSTYVRAMNIIMATKENVYLNTTYSEDPDYFSMHSREDDDRLIICSQAYEDDEGWETIPNGTIKVW